MERWGELEEFGKGIGHDSAVNAALRLKHTETKQCMAYYSGGNISAHYFKRL